MTTITTPTYIYDCESDELAPGIKVCKATGWGQMYSAKKQGAYVCGQCGAPLVLRGEPLPVAPVEKSPAQPLLLAPERVVAEQMGFDS